MDNMDVLKRKYRTEQTNRYVLKRKYESRINKLKNICYDLILQIIALAPDKKIVEETEKIKKTVEEVHL